MIPFTEDDFKRLSVDPFIIESLEHLRGYPKDIVIFTGYNFIEHPWFNNCTLVSEGGALENDRRSTLVKYVIVKSHGDCWKIYHSMDANICQHDYFNCRCHLEADYKLIYKAGAKLYNMKIVRSIVKAPEDVYNKYDC